MYYLTLIFPKMCCENYRMLHKENSESATPSKCIRTILNSSSLPSNCKRGASSLLVDLRSKDSMLLMKVKGKIHMTPMHLRQVPLLKSIFHR